MTEDQIPPARQEFARRLRQLRLPNGFKTARSLAQAIGIDENRYTRYERAEVEPSLEIIRRICEKLRVTPNDLLGTPAAADGAVHSEVRHVLAPVIAHSLDRGQVSGSTSQIANRRERAAWRLALAVADLESSMARAGKNIGPTSTHVPAEATIWFGRIIERPFATLTSILGHPCVAANAGEPTRSLRPLIDELTAAFAEPASVERAV